MSAAIGGSEKELHLPAVVSGQVAGEQPAVLKAEGVLRAFGHAAQTADAAAVRLTVGDGVHGAVFPAKAAAGAAVIADDPYADPAAPGGKEVGEKVLGKLRDHGVLRCGDPAEYGLQGVGIEGIVFLQEGVAGWDAGSGDDRTSEQLFPLHKKH